MNSADAAPVATTQPHVQHAPDRRLFVRIGGVALLLALTYLVFRIVAPLWQSLVWAALLGAVLSPWNTRLSARLGHRPRLASALTTVLTVLLFVLPLAMIAGTVAAQATQLLGKLEQIVPKAGADNVIGLNDIPWLERPLAWIGENTSFTLDQLQGWVIEGAKQLLQGLVQSSGSFVLGALGTIVRIALTLFVLFFVLRDGPRVATKLVAILPIEPERRARLWEHLQDVTRAVFMGIGLTAVAQGILIGLGCWIAGLPSPLVFGTLGAFFALIPFIGTTIIWAPGALYLASQGDPGHGIFLAVWGVVVVGMADNFLRPLLISGRSEVPTLAVFIGVMGGLSSFGFIGLFLGPIVLGLLVALFRFETDATVAATDRPVPPPQLQA